MITSVPLAWALTALFTATGGYALLRWSEAVSAGRSAAHRTAELAHVVMSAAMVLMTWTWSGTAGLAVQIGLFSVFALFFAVTAARGVHCGPSGPVAGAAHALMAAAMVWMLAAMPVIMPVAAASSGGGGGHAGHAGHGGGSGDAGHAMHAGQAGWAVAATAVLGAALLAVAGFWAVRALSRGAGSGDPFTPDDPFTPGDDVTGGPGAAVDCPDGCAPETAGTTSTAGTATALAARPGVATAPSRLGARTDAACHAVMSVGMVVMLAAMVAGW